MPKYHVTWVIDSDEPTPEPAACEALGAQRAPGSTATYFTVKNNETGESTAIDLDQIDSDASPSP
jgi:hypothetical protein